MPGELAAEERPDEPRVASVRSNGAAAARDAGRVPDAPRVEPAHRDSRDDVAQRVPVIPEALLASPAAFLRLSSNDAYARGETLLIPFFQTVSSTINRDLNLFFARAASRKDANFTMPGRAAVLQREYLS